MSSDPIEHWPVLPPPAAPARPRYPVELVVVRSDHASRLTTAFRLLLVIPHLGFSLALELGAAVVVAASWVCGVVTGSIPARLEAFELWTLRYRAWVDCYAVLLTDSFPPFDGVDDARAPVRVVGEPAERQRRWSVLLRPFLVLPQLFISLCLVFVLLLTSIAAWSAVMVAGRLPDTIADVLEVASAFILRTRAYASLLTDRYPWFEHDAPDEH